MTTATPEQTEAELQEEFLAKYRRLPAVQRRRVVERATPSVRLKLAHLEREMALERSPGSMAAVLTDGREMQAAHLDLIDQVFRDIAAASPARSSSPCRRGTESPAGRPLGARCGTCPGTPTTA
jgi:hypothetical protein